MRPVKIFFFLLFVLAFYRNPLMAQFTNSTLVPVGTNTSFEAGTVGWSISNPSSTQLVSRNWVDNLVYSSGPLGKQLLKLGGRGYVSQWVSIPATTQYHYLTVLAGRRPKTPGADPMAEGWAGVGITYYDSNWTELEFVSKPILREFPGDPTKIYSGIDFYSIGGVAPHNAAFASVWASNSSDKSELVIDNFYLTEFAPGKPTTVAPLFDSILAGVPFLRPTNPNLPGFLNTRIGVKSFNGPVLQIGSDTNDASGSMILRTKPGLKYYFQLLTTNTDQDSGQFGVDCYDASWNRLTTKNALFQYNPPDSTTKVAPDKFTGFEIQIPPNTATTYFWVGVKKGKYVLVRNADLFLVP